MSEAKKKKNKGGRPSTYTKKLADEICRRIAEGESVLQISKDKHIPAHSTIYLWLLDEDKKEFSDKYEKARIAQADLYFDELLEIADNGTNDYMERLGDDGQVLGYYQNGEFIARSRLRVDTRKWYLSKVMPKKYGDSLDLTTKGERIINYDDETIDRLIAARQTRPERPDSEETSD